MTKMKGPFCRTRCLVEKVGNSHQTGPQQQILSSSPFGLSVLTDSVSLVGILAVEKNTHTDKTTLQYGPPFIFQHYRKKNLKDKYFHPKHKY